jgi:hypothetical protein
MGKIQMRNSITAKKIFLLILLSGCSVIKQNTINNGLGSTELINITPTTIKVESPTTTITSEATIIVPTLISTYPINTPTNIPALTTSCTPYNGDIEGCVRQLMKNNNGCRYPCWWGINPGHTRINEAYGHMIDLVISGKSLLSKEFGEGIGFEMTIHEAIIGASIFGTDIVSIIQLKASNNINSSGDKFHDIIMEYLPRKLFQIYGIPTRIYISPDTTGAYYLLDLVYEQNNFIMSYYGFGKIITTTSEKYCPEIWNSRQHIQSIEFISKSSDITDSMEALHFIFGTPEAVEKTTMNAFYNELLLNENACIEIPINSSRKTIS